MQVSKKWEDGSFGVTLNYFEVKAIIKNAIRDHVKKHAKMNNITTWINLERYTTPITGEGERGECPITVSGHE